MSNTMLRLLLWALGQCLTRGSRFMPPLRAQITRTLVFELSAGERVARHWIFDAPQRRVTTRRGHAVLTDCSVHFASSGQAIRALVSRRTVDKVVAGLHDESIQLHGSAFVLLWFHGLTRKFVRLGSPAGPRHPVPDPYLAHDPAACGVETIVVEPVVVRLDPAWTDAWRARSTLLQVRATTGEPVLEP
jgi:hypothetical protein